MFGADKPVVGDLVLEANEDAEGTDVVVNGADDAVIEEDKPENGERFGTVISCMQPITTCIPDDTEAGKRSKRRKPWEPPRVKVLTEADLYKYTIFDVVMPLPGKDVSFPEGTLGERYKEFLRADGLDPQNWVRKQK